MKLRCFAHTWSAHYCSSLVAQKGWYITKNKNRRLNTAQITKPAGQETINMITLTLKTEYPADNNHHIYFVPTKQFPNFEHLIRTNSENNFQQTYTYNNPPTHPPEGRPLQKEHSGVTDTGWGLGNLHNLQAIGAYLIHFWKPCLLFVLK